MAMRSHPYFSSDCGRKRFKVHLTGRRAVHGGMFFFGFVLFSISLPIEGVGGQNGVLIE